jgi:PTH1 family peptidyl-tRNA hydrolase
MRKLVIGLGNPGPDYARTRHNVGFLCLDELAARHGLRFARGRARAEVATGSIAGQSIALAKPQTFMNDSGAAVAALVAFYQIAPGDLLVVSDDLDLPFGHLRLRAAGSAGGHNGLRSIIAHLRRQDFPRLRIGIGRPPERLPAERYVLLPFPPAERERLPDVLAAAADAAECWASEGLTTAMNRYNGWTPDAGRSAEG